MTSDFWSKLVEVGKGSLVTTLEALCAEVGAAESSILTPSGHDALVFFASTNPDLTAAGAPSVPIGASFSGLAFSSGQTIALADAARQAGHFGGVDALVSRPTLEFAAVPLVDRDVVGVLTLVNRRGDQGGAARPFSPAELARLGAVASDIAGAVAMLDAVGAGGAGLAPEFLRPLLALGPGERRAVQALVNALVENRPDLHEAV